MKGRDLTASSRMEEEQRTRQAVHHSTANPSKTKKAHILALKPRAALQGKTLRQEQSTRVRQLSTLQRPTRRSSHLFSI